MTKLEKANIPGVIVHEIGKSEKDNEIYVVEINDPKATVEELKERRVVLIYANEDGDEPDGCWVVNGAMNYLLKGIQGEDKEVKKILSQVTFIFIPFFDSVGWVNSTYGAMAYDFKYKGYDEYHRPEILAYTSFINKWCGYNKKRLDVVVNLHNIECNEGPNVMSPLLDTLKYNDILSLNKSLAPAFNDFSIDFKTVWLEGYTDTRFMGWISKMWGSIPVLYEINSRYPENRMNLAKLDNLGEAFVKGFYGYFASDEYEKALPSIDYTFSNQTKAVRGFIDNKILTKDEGLALYYNLEKGFYFPNSN